VNDYYKARGNALMMLLSPPRHPPIDPSLPHKLRWKIHLGRLQERHERKRYRRAPKYRAEMAAMRASIRSGVVDNFTGFVFIKTDLILGRIT